MLNMGNIDPPELAEYIICVFWLSIWVSGRHHDRDAVLVVIKRSRHLRGNLVALIKKLLRGKDAAYASDSA
jgi:hypothetical protein